MRSIRRFHSKRVQANRATYWKALGWVIEDVRNYGALKKSHFGCGCLMCKPWKHGCEEKYTIAERRRLQDENDEGGEGALVNL